MGDRLERALIAGLFALGACLALVAAYCFARSFDLHPQMGTIGEWLAAIFTAAAAGAALYIATRDREDRTAERAADHKAQAKLVVVDIYTTRTEREEIMYVVSVENFGALPLLDVSMYAASIGAHPDAMARMSKRVVELIPSGQQRELGKAVFFVSSEGVVVPKMIEQTSHGMVFKGIPKPEQHKVVCWVQFADAHGNRWAKSSDHELEYLGRIP